MTTTEQRSSSVFDTFYRDRLRLPGAEGRVRFLEAVLAERQPFFDAILRHLPPEKQTNNWALEVGCGLGINSAYLVKKTGLSIVGLDLSREALAMAQILGEGPTPRLSFCAGDALRMPFPEQSFALVFSQGVLEHFPDVAPIMTEQLRVLRDDGILVIDVPQRYHLDTLYRFYRKWRGSWDWGWETEYSYRDLLSWARRFNLTLVDVAGNGYNRPHRLVRFPYRTLCRKNPLRRTPFFNKVDRFYERFLDPAWECLWRSVERRWGHYFLLCITGVFRKGRG